MSAVQFQRQLGLSRYETAFGILHKLRAGMVRPDQDRIGGRRTSMSRSTKLGSAAGRVAKAGASTTRRWSLPPSRSAIGSRERTGQAEGRPLRRARPPGHRRRPQRRVAVWLRRERHHAGIADRHRRLERLCQPAERGYDHHAIAECGDPEVAEEFLPIIHLVFSNLKTWLNGIHHGVSEKHLQAYLNEFTFRFNRRFYPFNAFRSLLGIAGGCRGADIRRALFGEWQHPRCGGCRC